MIRIGLVSDTHDLVRDPLLAWLAGSDLIVHAGDVCGAAVLERLRAIAPVVAVRGNNDRGAWADALDAVQTLTVESVRIHVVHDAADLKRAPPPADVRVVVTGHSHRPAIVERDGVLFVNPGSAGPRRFKLPISAGELVVDGTAVRAALATLDP